MRIRTKKVTIIRQKTQPFLTHSGISFTDMEQATADSARVRALLDPKPDVSHFSHLKRDSSFNLFFFELQELKNPCTLVR